MKKAGLAAAAAGVAFTAAAVELGKKFTEAAITAQEETGKLAQALKNQGSSLQAVGPQVDALEKKQRKLGFTNSDTRQALTKFVTAGDNVAQATRDIGLASDYARVKNISLADA